MVIEFPNYFEMRKVQTWEMTEFTKRLPKFLENSRKNMREYLKNLKVDLNKIDEDKPLL